MKNPYAIILLVAATTAYGQIDNPPSSVNIVDATETGRAVLTATNAAAAATAVGLGWSALTNTNAATSLLGFTTNGQVVANTGASVLTFTNSVYIGGSVRILDGTNKAFEFPNDAEAEFSYAISFLNTAAATTRTNLGLGGTNTATFGNVVLNADGNLAPAQTADSGDSLMTRGLSDARYFGLKSHSINFAMMATKTASGGVSASSRGSWQIFTATNVNSFASAWGAWGYLLGLDGTQQYINFTNPLIISFSRTAAAASLPRVGLFQYVQLGRDVSTIVATNAKLAQKGLGIQFASNGVTPFVHNGTTLTDGSLITNTSTYNRFVLRWVPATAFEVYGVANGSEPVLLGSVTSNLPSGIGVSDSALEFMQLDSGSGGANAWFFLNTAYIITP